MSKLYELVTHQREVFDNEANYDPDTGEFLCDELLDSVEGQIDVKACDIAVIIKERKYDIASLKDEIKKLTDRKRVLERRTESLSDYLYDSLRRAGRVGKKISDSRIAISFRNVTRALVLDEGDVPDSFFEERRVLDKRKLTDALKESGEVPGAELETYQSMSVK
jgi:hypothetical protein